jgi:hypothetical protein
LQLIKVKPACRLERDHSYEKSSPRSSRMDTRDTDTDIAPPHPVPTPTADWRAHRKAAQLLAEPGRPASLGPNDERVPDPAPPIPLPFAFGARVLMWKQDPSVSEIGTRAAFLPGVVLDGPRDARIASRDPAIAAVSPNAFGDMTAIFLALSQLDQCEAVIAQTKARLHDKTFLADIAEQFGLALGTATGLRSADNTLTLSEAGSEVHALSQVFTGAIYDILADFFAIERDPLLRDDALVLHDVGAYLRALVLRALVAAPDQDAAYVDVVNAMLRISLTDGKPVAYRNSIRNRFTAREVVLSPVPLEQDHADDTVLVPHVQDAPGVQQDRRACCGTMNLAEYYGIDRLLDGEMQALAQWCAAHGRLGDAGTASDAKAGATPQ